MGNEHIGTPWFYGGVGGGGGGDVATSWQLRGLHVSVNYGAYVVVTGLYITLTGRLPRAPHNSHVHVDPVTTTG